MKKPNKFEQKILDVVLKELRKTMRTKTELTIVIDPWISGGTGAYVIAMRNICGQKYEIQA